MLRVSPSLGAPARTNTDSVRVRHEHRSAPAAVSRAFNTQTTTSSAWSVLSVGRLAGIFAVLVVAAAPASAQMLMVSWTGQRISIAAANVPLATVVNELARRTGSTVVGADDIRGSVTVSVREALLADALRAVLDGVDYLYLPQYSESAGAYDRFRLWVYPRTFSSRAAGAQPRVPARPCTSRDPGCDAVAPSAVAADATASPVATLTTERFPQGPSPADAEVARLNQLGVFNAGAPESAVLEAAVSADPRVRMRALEALAIRETRIARDAIAAAVNDPDPFVRSTALNLIVDQGGGPAESGRALRELLSHADADVRLSATTALGELTDVESEQQLRRALSDDDETVRNAAAQLLERRDRAKTLSKLPPVRR